ARQRTDGREQDRRPAGPPARIAVPQPGMAARIGNRLQLGSHQRDGDGEVGRGESDELGHVRLMPADATRLQRFGASGKARMISSPSGGPGSSTGSASRSGAGSSRSGVPAGSYGGLSG